MLHSLLKADVEGVLEHVSNLERSSSKEPLSDTVVSLIFQEVQQTGERMSGPDFCRQTHDLLFRAWQQNLGFYDPYAKFHYRNGLMTNEYYDLLSKLSLWNELTQTLYSLSPEHALDILHCIRNNRPDCKFPFQCLPVYLTICCSLSSQDIVREFLQHPLYDDFGHLSSLDPASVAGIHESMYNIYDKLLVYHGKLLGHATIPFQKDAEEVLRIVSDICDTLKSLSFSHLGELSAGTKHMNQLFWTKLRRKPLTGTVENGLLQAFLEESEDFEHISWNANASCVKPLSPSENQRLSICDVDQTLKRLKIPKSNAGKKHFSAFVEIYRLIENNCPVDMMCSVDPLEEQRTSNLAYKQDPYSLTTTDDTEFIQRYVFDCIRKIQCQSTGWISSLELMVDFQDLFWSLFAEDANLCNFIAKAIADENLQLRFFQRLSHNIFLYQQSEDLVDLQCIQILTGLLIAVFKAMSSRKQKLAFRNQIVYSNYQNGYDYTDITYGSIDLWSRKQILQCTTELRITCNQIVEQQDVNSHSNLTHNPNDTLIESLCWLSMVMPYAVLKRLVFGCIENKGQTTAVHLILQNLGNLCSLTPNSDEPPLLIIVLNSQELTASVSTLPSRHNYVDLVCQWSMVQTAYANENDNNDKAPNSLIPLLDIVEYFEWCLIPGLSKSVELGQDIINLLPAFLQLIYLTLSPLMELEDNADLPHAENSNNPPTQTRTLDWLLHVNLLQLISDLSTLLALRKTLVESQLSDEFAILSVLRYTDWEACVNSLDSLLRILLPDLNVKTPVHNLRRILDHNGAQQSFTILADRYREFDWDLQIKLYPLLTKVADHYGYGNVHITIPNELQDLFNGINTVAVMDTQDFRDKWALLMFTCKSATWIQDLIVKNLGSAIYSNTVCLHPYDNVGFVTGIYQALLPAKSLSVLPEYKRLLAGFIGQVFDLPTIPEVIREYDYENDSVNKLVNCLMIEDLRILHSILYSKMLLQTYTSVSNYQYGIPQPSSSVMEDEHNNEAIYFVSSIMRVIQSLQPWSSINDNGTTDLDSQPFSEYLYSIMPELQNDTGINEGELDSEFSQSDWSKHSEPVENEFDTYLQATGRQGRDTANFTPSSTLNNLQQGELLFPPESEYNLSKISLSVITLYILSQTKDQFQIKKLRESIWIFMLQIVEGLISDPRRKRLVQAAGKAGKASIKNWKKKTGKKYIVRCRPLLNNDQYVLIRQALGLLQDQQESHIIGQKLDISGLANSKLPRFYL